jgi:hypothetical protein
VYLAYRASRRQADAAVSGDRPARRPQLDADVEVRASSPSDRALCRLRNGGPEVTLNSFTSLGLGASRFFADAELLLLGTLTTPATSTIVLRGRPLRLPPEPFATSASSPPDAASPGPTNHRASEVLGSASSIDVAWGSTAEHGAPALLHQAGPRQERVPEDDERQAQQGTCVRGS